MGTKEKIRTIKRVVNGKTYRFRIGENYHDRTAFSKEACEAGDHWHNPVEDECCPCFGCCVPELAKP